MRWLIPLLLLLSCRQSPPAAPPPLDPTDSPEAQLPRDYAFPEKLASARVVAVGDVLVHTNVKHSAAAVARYDESGATLNQDGWVDLFEHVDTFITEADIAFANLETPVAPDHHMGTRSMTRSINGVIVSKLASNNSFSESHSGQPPR